MGVTVEEQLTGSAEFGGIQIKAWPLKASAYEAWARRRRSHFAGGEKDFNAVYCLDASLDMGLGMGGSMQQHIYQDQFGREQWETGYSSRCYVHLLNAEGYAEVTGHLPPHRPYDAGDYAAAGLPWFDYYSDQSALGGSERFKGLKSWREFQEGPEQPVNVEPGSVVQLGAKHGRGRPVTQGDKF